MPLLVEEVVVVPPFELEEDVDDEVDELEVTLPEEVEVDELVLTLPDEVLTFPL